MSLDPARAARLRSIQLGRLAMEHRTTLAVIEHALDDKLDFSPHPMLRPFGVIALHIYRTGSWFAKIMETGKVEHDPELGSPLSPKQKDALIQECDVLNREVANRVNALSPEMLARIIEFPSYGPFPGVAYLGRHLDHMIHHRGQLSVYLRLMGARVPSIYGPTLDYP